MKRLLFRFVATLLSMTLLLLSCAGAEPIKPEDVSSRMLDSINKTFGGIYTSQDIDEMYAEQGQILHLTCEDPAMPDYDVYLEDVTEHDYEEIVNLKSLLYNAPAIDRSAGEDQARSYWIAERPDGEWKITLMTLSMLDENHVLEICASMGTQEINIGTGHVTAHIPLSMAAQDPSGVEDCVAWYVETTSKANPAEILSFSWPIKNTLEDEGFELIAEYAEDNDKNMSDLEYDYVCINGMEFIKMMDADKDAINVGYLYEEDGNVHLLQIRSAGDAFGYEAAIAKTFGF